MVPVTKSCKKEESPGTNYFITFISENYYVKWLTIWRVGVGNIYNNTKTEREYI